MQHLGVSNITGAPLVSQPVRIYACLVASLVATKLLFRGLAIDFKTPEQSLMFDWWFIGVLSVYGAVGVWLVPRTGFAGISGSRRGALLALVHGSIVGICTIISDIVRPVNDVLHVNSMHHALPEGILLYWCGAVVSEVWFHLLPVPLFVFIGSNVALRGRHRQRVFWSAALLLSFWEGRRIFTDSELWVPVEIARGAITYAANFSEIWLFRRFGFMAAIEQRLASYAWWHVLWPAVSNYGIVRE